MVHNIYNSPVPCNTDSDESDGDEMLPLGAFWPEPEDEEWTVVERVHRCLRGTKGIDSDRFYNYGEKLDHPGMRCGQLDYIDETDNRGTRSEVMPSNRREATQYDNPPTGVEPATESATASVKPAVCRRPNVIVVLPSKTTDRRVNCPVNVVGTQARELFPEEPEVIPAEMAEEASTGDLTDNQPLSVNQLVTLTTVTILATDYDEIERPAPWRMLVEVAEEAGTNDTTIEKCMCEVLDNNETTERKLSREVLDIPQQSVTRGFLELAEEAREIGVEKKQSFLVGEVLPQITEMTRPMIEPVSWTIDEDLGQSVEVLCEGTARVPTVRFDVGQLMQWPDIKSAGVMIRGIMVESEMSSIGSVRRAAEPVSVAAKSEMLTLFLPGGGVVAEAATLVVVEAVTSRVSVLPVVGSDLLTGLSVAAGGTDQLFLGSGGILDKVGHGAGQSGVRIVLVECLLKLREVRDIMFSWMRPVAVLTSQFFLSDEGDDVEMPLHINDDRASLQQKVDFNCENVCPQWIEQVQKVGPSENRWDGHRILDIICWFCKWLNTRSWTPEMAFGKCVDIISGNYVQEQFHDRFNIPEGIQKYQIAFVYEAWQKQPVWLIGMNNTTTTLIGSTDIRTERAVR